MLIAFDTTQVTSRQNRSNSKPGDPCHPLAAGAHPPAVAYRTSPNSGAWETGDRTDALTTGTDRTSRLIAGQMRVRRILPVEAERLMGFPDGYTAIPWRGKPASECPDGPRYKVIGNAMAVTVMRWIGERIQAVDARGPVRALLERREG